MSRGLGDSTFPPHPERGRPIAQRSVRVSARVPMDGPPPVACGHLLPLSGGGHNKMAVPKTGTTTNGRRAFIRRRLIVVAVRAMGAYSHRPSPVTIGI